MAAFKQFLAQDLIVTPFEVNKGFSFLQSEFGDSDVQIDRFQGTNVDFTTNKTTTGTLSTEYQALVYSSVKQLYYSNFLSSSAGSSVSVPELLPGYTPDGDTLIGSASSAGRYENYLQSTNDVFRKFPTGSNDKVAVLSIPSRLWGDYIQPNSFKFEITDPGQGGNYTIVDDGNGQIAYNTGGYLGNIIYTHGIIIFTNCADNAGLNEGYGTGSYGENIYGGGNLTSDDIINATNVTCSFSSSFDIYETQYKATINEFEYNFSQNPSIISGSTDGTVYDFVTGSYFSPYATTVGLYDNDQNLLAVGKLSQPLPISRTTDTTIFINIDR